jgi:hypothetical protein
MNVGSHVEHGLEFAQYRTYDWGSPDALPAGDPRLEKNGLYRDHVEGAIEKQLDALGLDRTAEGTPDLLIHYHASTSRRIDVSRNETGAYCYPEDCRTGVIEFETVTLVLDVVDAYTPGLTLTLPQATELWDIDAESCTRALQRLVAAGFLRSTGGMYRRETGYRAV